MVPPFLNLCAIYDCSNFLGTEGVLSILGVGTIVINTKAKLTYQTAKNVAKCITNRYTHVKESKPSCSLT